MISSRRIVLLIATMLLLAGALWQGGIALGAAPRSGSGTRYLPLILKAPAPTPEPPRAPSFEERVIQLTNQERAKAGLAALTPVAELNNAARGHSQDMATTNLLSHTGSDGSDPGQRITRAGYIWRTYGENVAAGYTTPESVVAGWMQSDGHRANILNPAFRDIGVGYAYGASSTYKHYWTQVFAAR